jgi:hypothetical protein
MTAILFFLAVYALFFFCLLFLMFAYDDQDDS